MNTLTTSEAAERLGVTRWRVNALIKSGRLKAQKKGQIYLIEERDLAAVSERKPGRPAKAAKKGATMATMVENQARFDERQNKMEETQTRQAKEIDGILKASADLVKVARMNSRQIKTLVAEGKETREMLNALLRIVDGHLSNHP